MALPRVFANLSGTIPLSFLDDDFNNLDGRVTAGISTAYVVINLRANPNSVTPLTQIDYISDLAVVRNPSTGAISVQVAPPTITQNIGLAGPIVNGRDQAAAFPANSFIHTYYIWNGTTLATESSLTAPATGPALPGGYTHWGYLDTRLLDGAGNLVSMRTHGCHVEYDASRNVLLNGAAIAETVIVITAHIPAIATMFFGVARYYGLTATAGGLANTTLSLRIVPGADAVTSAFSLVTTANAQQLLPGPVFALLNRAQYLAYLQTITSGSAPLSTVDLFGYTVPNGDT